MANPETLSTIITSALARANSPGISAEALTFVKRLFAHLYRTHAFPFNITTASVTTINTHEISLTSLTTFRSTYLLKLDDIEQPLEETYYKDLWPKVKHDEDNASTGTPQFFTCDPGRTKLLLWPRPAISYTGTLMYYAAPSTSSWTTSTNIEYEDALAVEAAICDWALNYDKEPLQVIVERQAAALHAEYVNNLEAVGKAKQPTLRWGRNFKPIRGD